MYHIERNKERGFGQPVIAGTGLTVFSVINNAYWSENLTKFLEDFNLTMEQLIAALLYCKARQCKKMECETDKYCNGCILRSIGEGWNSISNDFIDKGSVSISKDGQSFSLATIEEIDNDEFGIMGWVVAEKLEKKISY